VTAGYAVRCRAESSQRGARAVVIVQVSSGQVVPRMVGWRRSLGRRIGNSGLGWAEMAPIGATGWREGAATAPRMLDSCDRGRGGSSDLVRARVRAGGSSAPPGAKQRRELRPEHGPMVGLDDVREYGSVGARWLSFLGLERRHPRPARVDPTKAGFGSSNAGERTGARTPDPGAGSNWPKEWLSPAVFGCLLPHLRIACHRLAGRGHDWGGALDTFGQCTVTAVRGREAAGLRLELREPVPIASWERPGMDEG
jgi:hypothetical protein